MLGRLNKRLRGGAGGRGGRIFTQSFFAFRCANYVNVSPIQKRKGKRERWKQTTKPRWRGRCLINSLHRLQLMPPALQTAPGQPPASCAEQGRCGSVEGGREPGAPAACCCTEGSCRALGGVLSGSHLMGPVAVSVGIGGRTQCPREEGHSRGRGLARTGLPGAAVPSSPVQTH